MSSIKHGSTEQDWANGTTRVWFDVNGKMHGVVVESGDYSLIDNEGYPIEPQNDHENLLETLKPLTIEAMADEV